MRLNTLSPAPGSRKKRVRVGRGIGSGIGKTCGLGHKGQKARAGGYHKVGFEGGQMPLQRRLPKFGFTSPRAGQSAEVRLGDLAKVGASPITLQALREAGLVRAGVKRVKVILSGTLDRPLRLEGIAVTRGARVVIEKAGGSIEA